MSFLGLGFLRASVFSSFPTVTRLPKSLRSLLIMSFGRPGNFSDSFQVSPPEKGSFPLDHDRESSSSFSFLPSALLSPSSLFLSLSLPLSPRARHIDYNVESSSS